MSITQNDRDTLLEAIRAEGVSVNQMQSVKDFSVVHLCEYLDAVLLGKLIYAEIEAD